MGLIDRLTLGPADATALARIATALERLADHFEGRTPAQPLPEAPLEPITLANTEDRDRFWAKEVELTQLLGRAPTEEELVAAVDGHEWAEEDAEAVLAKVEARRRASLPTPKWKPPTMR